MAGRDLTKRVAVLETAADFALKRWVQIIQETDQTQEEAVALWEAENGSTEDCNILLVRIV